MKPLDKLFPGTKEYDHVSTGKIWTLGVQHVFTMACATIMVPLVTGLNVSVTLFAAGLGTLLFHFITKGRVPTFLGSSSSFIPAICAIMANPEFGATTHERASAAMGGIITVGIIYVAVSIIIRLFGTYFIEKLIPPIVRGVSIALIGLNLAVIAVNNVQSSGFELFSSGYIWGWSIALFTLMLAICLSTYGKGMAKMVSIFIALFAGYAAALILVKTGLAPQELMDFENLAQQGRGLARAVIELPEFTFPTFNGRAIAMIAPVAIVSCVEHIGDIYAIGAVTGKDFAKDPGLHRTILGDGLATALAGALGAPSNTTYSENTAVLATTGNFNPASIRAAAVITIGLSFFGKAVGLIETIPGCVLGGVCILLYGMIASVGLRTLVESKVDFSKNRNLSISSVMLVLSLGGAAIGGAKFSLSGVSIGIVSGIVLNAVLPQKEPNIK